jgi:membrane dipeptidase
LIDTPRNLDDSQIEALAHRGGVVGIMAHPVAIDPARPTLDRVVDHVLHAVDVAGPEHVCIGADFIRQVCLSGAIPPLTGALLPHGLALEDPIVDYEGPADYPRLVDRLAARGVDDDTLERILWSNLLRMLGDGLPEDTE